MKEKNNKLIINVIFTLLIIFITGCGNSNVTENSNNNEVKDSSNKNIDNPVVELTEQQKMLKNIVALMDEDLAFDSGSYIAGDIPKGEYAFVKFEGSGSYYSEKDIAGNIIDNENFDSFGYVQVHGVGNITNDAVLININAFNKLNVSGAKEIYEILNELTNYNQSGMYKIGTDIEAGTYTLQSIGEAYISILSGPISNNKIIDNDFFNGKYQVKVKKGQYLQISKAIIE